MSHCISLGEVAADAAEAENVEEITMLVVVCLVGVPMCYTFPHIILVTQDLGRILESLCHA
jgi:hypothetical protein